MKPRPFASMLIGVLLLGPIALRAEKPETVDIIFAGGQSNATQEWASGIHQVLLDSGAFSNLRMDVWHLPRVEKEKLGQKMAKAFVQKLY
ncbi:hypothetical protein SH580_00855 [Coraliomargarita algicola]|uniref:Uncharacterized protein n=1 Tax=Coraliomargarita algicola TaxID=3092156 RepID=A0ABZ0RMN4_9BACT|nr:hypothetical protein [Coraliomargarita sp. J2-16]WPJ96250.1 hypothetical protein SH580_00855 [Coraliomargarita sp. J2-16]